MWKQKREREDNVGMGEEVHEKTKKLGGGRGRRGPEGGRARVKEYTYMHMQEHVLLCACLDINQSSVILSVQRTVFIMSLGNCHGVCVCVCVCSCMCETDMLEVGERGRSRLFMLKTNHAICFSLQTDVTDQRARICAFHECGQEGEVWVP